jgi:FAD/FMN-containing dehydrogenase
MNTKRIANIERFLAALERAASSYPMTMGWIDCLNRGKTLGRGVLMAGRWATVEQVGRMPPMKAKERTIPCDLPNWVMNRWTARLFNTVYYRSHLRSQSRRFVGPNPFFYPLDAILQWNRIYGRRGFTQYQCVIPRSAGFQAVREFLNRLVSLGSASPLCVIKDCGPQGKGVLSFPMEGTSIAVDMAVSPEIQKIVDHLNEFVIAVGGRIYLTKDRFTRPKHFRAMELRLETFFAARERWDRKRLLRSAQSVRLFGDKS